MQRCRRYGDGAGMVRDHGNRFAILRSARAALRLAFVAQELELGQQRKIEIVDPHDVLAHVQRHDQVERRVDLGRGRIGRKDERFDRQALQRLRAR